MKDLFSPPPEPLQTPADTSFEYRTDRSGSIVRSVAPEDPYDDRSFMSRSTYGRPPSRFEAPASRQISQTSSTNSGGTMQSGSENWETFSEQSDEPPERDVDFYKYRQEVAPNKRWTPDGGYAAASPRAVQGKKLRGIRSVDSDLMIEGEGGRMVRVMDGSEAGWTDDGDGY